MHTSVKSFVRVAATLTPLATFAAGEAAQQYTNNNKILYVKQQLLKRQRNATLHQTTDDSRIDVSAWLGTAPPKFPYLLSISSGDNPAIVINKLLTGANVLGSCHEPTRDTLKKLTLPTSPFDLAIHWVATLYSVKAEDESMDAILDALRDMHGKSRKNAENGEGAPSKLWDAEVAVPLVFLLRDFDAFNDQETEHWLRWIHLVLRDELAHVVLLTTSTVTPAKVQRIQERHQCGLSGVSNDVSDFVGILLRPANGLVDSTSAEEKLRDLTELHNLNLFVYDNQNVGIPTAINDRQGTNAMEGRAKRTAEMDYILETTGNWWSDIDDICQRLMQNNFNDMTQEQERLARIRDVCSSFAEETQVKLLEALHLEQFTREFQAGGQTKLLHGDAPIVVAKITDTSKVFSALESWKCLERVAQVTPVAGGGSLVHSANRLLNTKEKTPLNCESLVEALLPFTHHEKGECMFLDLIDMHILHLRPKEAMEIDVIPCKKAELVSPCWVQMRPAIKKAFETLHTSNTYCRIILELDRFAANIEMQNELELYALEISDRRKVLSDMTRHYETLQFSMTPAEKAQRKAELALMDVELRAKDVYLDKLRSLVAP